MAHGYCMNDWEELAQRQVMEIQNELPESIRSCAMEVPVFFARGRGTRASSWLGVFEGCSRLSGSPALPDELPRITLFLDNLAKAANYDRMAFLREVRMTYLHELGHYLGWDETQIANIGLA
jgi:predicted Zn-dependent protease with MMP-like domain